MTLSGKYEGERPEVQKRIEIDASPLPILREKHERWRRVAETLDTSVQHPGSDVFPSVLQTARDLLADVSLEGVTQKEIKALVEESQDEPWSGVFASEVYNKSPVTVLDVPLHVQHFGYELADTKQLVIREGRPHWVGYNSRGTIVCFVDVVQLGRGLQDGVVVALGGRSSIVGQFAQGGNIVSFGNSVTGPPIGGCMVHIGDNTQSGYRGHDCYFPIDPKITDHLGRRLNAGRIQWHAFPVEGADMTLVLYDNVAHVNYPIKNKNSWAPQAQVRALSAAIYSSYQTCKNASVEELLAYDWKQLGKNVQQAGRAIVEAHVRSLL